MSTYGNFLKEKGQIKVGRDSLDLDAAKYGQIPETLPDIESEIEKLKKKLWEYAWYIGQRLLVIKDSHLKETGFINIAEYAKAKFGFSPTTTYRFIYLAANYDRFSALKHGSKLYLLWKLEENKRNEYLDWIRKDDPTYREIEDKIKNEYGYKKRRIPHLNKDFDITKTKLIVNFRKMGVNIEKNKQKDFLNELEALINKFAGKT